MVYLANILEETTADGPGLRTSIYFQGCPIHCEHCHNKSLWDISKGTLWEIKDIISLLSEDPFLDGISILGGEPFYQPEALFKLVKAIKSELPKLSIWVYSGYRLDQIKESDRLAVSLPYIDVLVDGPYVEELKCKSPFKGSSNQRIVKNPSKYEV